MDSPQRQRFVLEELRRTGRVEVGTLASAMKTSEITVRRDLEHLASAGALRRIRGGAVSTALRGEGLPFDLRAADEVSLKERLGQAAAAMIVDGEAVSIDSGTTGAAAARALAHRRITALPMSLQSLIALQGAASIIVPGGEMNPVEGSFGGPLLQQSLKTLRLDTALLSCCAADPSAGVMAYTLGDAASKRTAQEVAERTILIAESTKFGRNAMARICQFDQVTALVSDDGLPESVREYCHTHGIAINLVPREAPLPG